MGDGFRTIVINNNVNNKDELFQPHSLFYAHYSCLFYANQLLLKTTYFIIYTHIHLNRTIAQRLAHTLLKTNQKHTSFHTSFSGLTLTHYSRNYVSLRQVLTYLITYYPTLVHPISHSYVSLFPIRYNNISKNEKFTYF